jgi:hypoxanthine phosphoribosyltransferase
MGKIKVAYPEAEAQRLVERIDETAKAYYDEAGGGLPKLVLLPRTGYEIGATIARSWGIGATGIFHASIERHGNQFEYGQMPATDEVAGQSLLVLDGVCKSGETLQHVVDLLTLAGAGLVKTGVMMYKPHETTTNYVPDFVGEQVADGAFYVFPWEWPEHLPEPAEDMSASIALPAGSATTQERSV